MLWMGMLASRKKKSFSGDIDGFVLVVWILCAIFVIGVTYSIVECAIAKPEESLPQVDINVKFISISGKLSYEEETMIVYIENNHRGSQRTHSIYFDHDGKPMKYTGVDIPFEMKEIGRGLVVDTNTGVVYRQEGSTYKNYSAYYGEDGLLRYYSKGELYPINNQDNRLHFGVAYYPFFFFLFLFSSFFHKY